MEKLLEKVDEGGFEIYCESKNLIPLVSVWILQTCVDVLYVTML